MYDPEVTQRAIDSLVARTTTETDPCDRFHGVSHTRDECQHFLTHMAALIDSETGELTRTLTDGERSWVTNERWMCTLDYRYWVTRYARIVDDSNKLTNFIPNAAQEMVIDIWGQMERRAWAIMMIQLKARQLGVSTLTELAVLHRILFYPDVNAVVASCDDDKSAKMSRMLEMCWSQQPWWLIPGYAQHKIGRLIVLKNNSVVSIESGNQFNGIARGTTPSVAHLSELVDFQDPRELVDASLLHAMHPHPWTFLILESTAKGFDNWWHDKWYSAVKGWRDGTGTLCPIFLPWFTRRDIYPTETWLRAHPIPNNYAPDEMTGLHAQKCQVYVRNNAMMRKFYAPEWTLPVAQQWWYQIKRNEARREKRLNAFLSEMPADPDEAFQSTNISAVEIDLVTAYKEKALAGTPKAVFGVLADPAEIPTRLQPTKRSWLKDGSVQDIPLTTTWGAAVSRYTLKALTFEGYDSDPSGKLFVWEYPEDGEEYGIGVDTSDGVGQDRSVVQVIRKQTLWKPWAQVAEFASPYMNALDFWPIVQAIACFYSVNRGGGLKQPRLAIEVRGNGEICQLELKKRGWANFHPWVRYDGKQTRPDKAMKLGIMTTSWFRRMMMDKILSIFNNEDIVLPSPWLIEEFRRLERDELQQQFRADSGGHDDRVMALGFVLMSLDMLMLNSRVKRRQSNTDDDDDPPYVQAQSLTSAGEATPFGLSSLAQIAPRRSLRARF